MMLKRFFQGLLLFMLQHPNDPDLIEREVEAALQKQSDK